MDCRCSSLPGHLSRELFSFVKTNANRENSVSKVREGRRLDPCMSYAVPCAWDFPLFPARRGVAARKRNTILTTTSGVMCVSV